MMLLRAQSRGYIDRRNRSTHRRAAAAPDRLNAAGAGLGVHHGLTLQAQIDTPAGARAGAPQKKQCRS